MSNIGRQPARCGQCCTHLLSCRQKCDNLQESICNTEYCNGVSLAIQKSPTSMVAERCDFWQSHAPIGVSSCAGRRRGRGEGGCKTCYATSQTKNISSCEVVIKAPCGRCTHGAGDVFAILGPMCIIMCNFGAWSTSKLFKRWHKLPDKLQNSFVWFPTIENTEPFSYTMDPPHSLCRHLPLYRQQPVEQ
jgi:hypothetical protein